MSSDKFIIFETLTPGAGSNSFKLTTGPWLTFFILPSTPKSKRIFSKKSLSTLSFFKVSDLSALEGVLRKSIVGNLNFTFKLLLLLFCVKGRFSWISFSSLSEMFS